MRKFVFSGSYASAPPYVYLVDAYSPTAAFSLRKLSSTSTNAIRVRRSSDNVEQDIGFVGDDLDTASILSFVGANDGRVVKWYNQGIGGATYDYSQSVLIDQPYIVASGVLLETGGKAAVRNTSGAEWLEANTILASDLQILTFFGVWDYVASGSVWSHRSSVTPLIQIRSENTMQIRSTGTALQTLSLINNLNQKIVYAKVNNIIPSHAISVNNGAEATNTTLFSGTITSTKETIGGSNSGSYTDISQTFIQEIILFTSDESANKTGILTDINSYYVIY
jgi:hypothetical protein